MTQPIALVGSSAVPVSVGNFLRLQFSYHIDGDTAVVIRALVLADSGNIEQYSETETLAAAQTNAVVAIPIQDGLLLTVSADVNGSGALPGTIYCQIGIRQSSITSDDQIQKLTSGYISDGQFLAFPYSQPAAVTSEASPSIPGSFVPPSAGAEINADFVDSGNGQLLGISVPLVTSAAVAIRRVSFILSSNLGPTVTIQARTDQLASKTVTYLSWSGPNIPADDTVSGIYYIPWPQTWLSNSWLLSTVTANLDGADEFGTLLFWFSRQASF